MTIMNKKVLVLGGGIIGLSIAYYLQRSGKADVTLLEGGNCGAGTTSQAAALLTRARSDINDGLMVDETHNVIRTFEQQSGEAFMQRHGCVHIASNNDQLVALQKHEQQAQVRGLDCRWLNGKETATRFPWLKCPSTDLGLYYPDDGHADPYLLAQYYFRAAKFHGAQIRQHSKVEELTFAADKLTGVITNSGEAISADSVVVALGPWSSVFLAQYNVPLAMSPVRSHYWITNNLETVSPDHSMAIVPAAKVYLRPENRALLFGVRDSQMCVADPQELPGQQDAIHGFQFSQDNNGWAALEENWQQLMALCPQLENAELNHYISGISSYTPDGLPLLGACKEITDLYLATGCSGAGIAWSGGIGRLMSELILDCPTFVTNERYDPYRFDNITEAADSLNPEFRHLCALGRAQKKTG